MNKFELGDKVVCIDSYQSFPKLVHGKVYNVIQQDDKFVKLLEHSVSFFASRFELADPMSHLYDNEKPFGLLSEEEQQYMEGLRTRDIQIFSGSNWRTKKHDRFGHATTYRVKRPPERVSITSLTGTVEMKDGKPDWSTYKE